MITVMVSNRVSEFLLRSASGARENVRVKRPAGREMFYTQEARLYAN